MMSRKGFSSIPLGLATLSITTFALAFAMNCSAFGDSPHRNMLTSSIAASGRRCSASLDTSALRRACAFGVQADASAGKLPDVLAALAANGMARRALARITIVFNDTPFLFGNWIGLQWSSDHVRFWLQTYLDVCNQPEADLRSLG